MAENDIKIEAFVQANTRISQPIALLIIALLIAVWWISNGGGGFPLDDSWIHQTYARNLAQHGEWAFIPGEPSAASTSPLYTVVLAIGYLLRVPYELWAHLIGGMALAMMGIIGARMTRKLLPDVGWASWFVGFALIATWHLIWAAVSGMETIIFAMLTLLLIHLAWRETDEGISSEHRHQLLRAAIFGIVSALTTLARPEGILLVGLIGLSLLLIRPHNVHFAENTSLSELVQTPKGSLLRTIQWGVVAVIAFLIVLSPYLLLNYQLTDGLLPNTASAKFQQHAILLTLPLTRRISNLLIAILAGGQAILIPGMVAFVAWIIRGRSGRNRWILLLPLLWSAGLILLYALRLPASYQHGRYVIPALPALILMGSIGTVLLLRWFRRQMLLRVAGRALLVSFILMTLYFTVIEGPGIYRVDVSIINEEMVASALWIQDNLPEDELLAIHDIGAVGYFASRPMLDIAGLVSPELVDIVDDADALWALMEAENATYLMAFPDQIPGDSTGDPRLCVIHDTEGKTARAVGGPNMVIYRLAWDENCD